MRFRFTSRWLAVEVARLRPAQAGGRLLVACSGGHDSGVLLHACAAAGVGPLAAVYVDHGLHADATHWGDHVATACRRADVALTRLCVQVDGSGNVEARARAARYAALAGLLDAGDVLLTAHHGDDQLETVLLQLLRGAGPAGMAAMPSCRSLGRGWHLRPLLGVPRDALRAYGERHGVTGVDDPANRDRRFERSFVRSEIVPLLKSRWPAALDTVSRSAQLCAQAAQLADDLARIDGAATEVGAPLLLPALLALPGRRLTNAIRGWLQHQRVALPNRARLDEFVRQLRAAGDDRHPQLRYGKVEVRRYQDGLYLLPGAPPPPAGWSAQLPPGGRVSLPAGLGELAWRDPAAGAAGESLTVAFRRGGEALRLRDSDQRTTLKSLFQQQRVLPWWRSRVPLLWAADRLVAVGDLWFDPAWCRRQTGGPPALVWRGRPALCAPAGV